MIEDDVFVASNAFILPGTTLSRGCIVSAGAVVNGKTYRPYSILGGNPARVIGYRGGMGPDKTDARENIKEKQEAVVMTATPPQG